MRPASQIGRHPCLTPSFAQPTSEGLSLLVDLMLDPLIKEQLYFSRLDAPLRQMLNEARLTLPPPASPAAAAPSCPHHTQKPL